MLAIKCITMNFKVYFSINKSLTYIRIKSHVHVDSRLKTCLKKFKNYGHFLFTFIRTNIYPTY